MKVVLHIHGEREPIAGVWRAEPPGGSRSRHWAGAESVLAYWMSEGIAKSSSFCIFCLVRNAQFSETVWDWENETQVFTALHGMQTRSSDENSVCLPVCLSARLSVWQTRDFWQNGRKIGPYFYIIQNGKMVGGGDPFYLKYFGSNWPRWSEIADFRSLFARSDSAVTPSKKVKVTLIGSPLHAFQWAQDDHRTLSLCPQRVAENAMCPKFEQ